MSGVQERITVDFDDTQVQDVLNRVLRVTDNTEPVMMEIAEYLHGQTREHFDNEQAPDGTPWAKVKPETQEEKNQGYYVGGERTSLPIPGKTLHGVTLNLRDMIHPFWSKTEAGVSTGMETDAYAAAHQFGTEGMTISVPSHQRLMTQVFGRQLPFPVWATVGAYSFKGGLPARPFLGIGPDDEREILDILEDEYLQGSQSA